MKIKNTLENKDSSCCKNLVLILNHGKYWWKYFLHHFYNIHFHCAHHGIHSTGQLKILPWKVETLHRYVFNTVFKCPFFIAGSRTTPVSYNVSATSYDLHHWLSNMVVFQLPGSSNWRLSNFCWQTVRTKTSQKSDFFA